MNSQAKDFQGAQGVQVRNLKFFPPLIQAPMAGVGHSAFRKLLLGFGGVGLLTTEMLSARRLPSENPTISPFLIKSEDEKPLCYQLLVTNAAEIDAAIEALHRFGAQAVDINLGCPAPRVRQAGGGALLMDQLGLVKEIVATARKATDLPLSVKIRLGENLDEKRLITSCRQLEDEGIDLLTIHARLRGESFTRKPRWDWVGKVKKQLQIPVVANGGIFSPSDALRCLEQSGADGLMLGRGCAERPWLFADIAHRVYGVPLQTTSINLERMYEDFVAGLAVFRPERRLGRLKEFTHYFAKNFQFGHHLATAVQSSQELQGAVERAQQFFQRLSPEKLQCFLG